MIPGQIIDLTGSPHGCPEAAQVSEGCLALQPGTVFPEAISTPDLLSQFQTETGAERKYLSFSLPWGSLEKMSSLLVVPNCPLSGFQIVILGVG